MGISQLRLPLCRATCSFWCREPIGASRPHRAEANMVLVTVLCSMMAAAVLAEGPAGLHSGSNSSTAAFIGLVGADLTLKRTVGGGPVRFNGVDIIALHRSVEAAVGLLAARSNLSSAVPANRPEILRVPRAHFVGRNGTNIEINADVGGRVLVDNIDVTRAAWLLRGTVDAIKTSWLGSSALLPNAAGTPLTYTLALFPPSIVDLHTHAFDHLAPPDPRTRLGFIHAYISGLSSLFPSYFLWVASGCLRYRPQPLPPQTSRHQVLLALPTSGQAWAAHLT